MLCFLEAENVGLPVLHYKSLGRGNQQHELAPRVAAVEPQLSGSFLLKIVWHRRKTVAFVTFACVAAAVLYLLCATPVYTVTSRLYVAQFPKSAMNGEAQQATDRP